MLATQSAFWNHVAMIPRPGRLQREMILVVALVGVVASLTAITTALPVSSGLKPAIAAALAALASTIVAPWANSTVRAWLSVRESTAKKDELGSAAEARSPREPGKRFPRVGTVNPETLGVNPAIRVAWTSGGLTAPAGQGGFPPYVDRDLDKDLRLAIQRVREAGSGGLFVLVGAPLSGKTRTAYEAIRAVVPGWNIFVPGTMAELAAVIDSGRSLQGTVIWMDELGEFLEGELPLQPGAVRRLISRGVGAVIVGTLWPEQFEKLKQRPSPESLDNAGEDNLGGQRSILRMAHVFNVLTQLSPDECARAERLGPEDARILQALASEQYSFTQVLGAAPDLIQHWRQASEYAKAVMDAAIDLRRAGYALPIPADLLREIAASLLTDGAKAAAERDWFEAAVGYATRTLQGAVKALFPVGTTVRVIDGYAVADFLQDVAVKERGRLPIPVGVWEALQGTELPPFELVKLGRNAQARLSLDYAEDFLVRAFRASPDSSWLQLIALYEQQGRLADMEPILRQASARGLPGSYERLAVLYQRLRRPEQLVQVLDEAQRSGSVESLWLLRSLVLRTRFQSEAEEVYRAAADAGSSGAWQILVHMLTSEGRVAEARQIIENAESRGDADAWWTLATMLANTPEEFERRLREAVQQRKPGAWVELANLLVVTGRSSEAINLLTQAVNDGQPGAAEELIETLEELGRGEEAQTLKTKGMKFWTPEEGTIRDGRYRTPDNLDNQ
jgi:hypothetical protein